MRFHMKFINISSLKYLIIASLAATMISCGGKDSSATPEEGEGEEHHEEAANTVEFTEVQFKNSGLKLAGVERKQISGTIRVNGMLNVPPQQQVSISAQMGGFLKETELLPGSRVRKGQVIGRIENLDFIQLQQDYLDSKSQLELARIEYDRQQQLASQNVNSAKILQQAKATFVSSQARYNGLSEKLKVLGINPSSLDNGNLNSTINLYSPINGYVTKVNVNLGKYVNPTDVIFEIVDTEHLHAELIVFEKDVPKLRIGQKVRFTLTNETTERLATIYLIGREISPERTIQIHCHITKEDRELLPGTYLSAAVETGGAEVTALPESAIIDFQGKKYVFVKSEQPAAQPAEKAHDEKAEKGTEHTEAAPAEKEPEYHFTMVEIQIGSTELGYTEVMLPADFKADSQVAVTGGYALLSKIKNSEDEGGHH